MEILDAATLFRRCGDSTPDLAPDWSTLLCRFGPRLEAGARRALRRAGAAAQPEAVEDLMQEICCRLWEKRSTSLRRFRGSSEAQAACYLFRLAENTALDVLRAAAAKRRAPQSGGRHDSRCAELLADAAPTPEEWTLSRERRRLLLRQLRALCAGERGRRSAWILRRALVDGWSAREIAGVLGGGGDAAVQSLIFRARRRLRRLGIEISRR